MSGTDFSSSRAILFDVLHTLVDDSGFPKFQIRKMLRADGHEPDLPAFEEIYKALTKREYDWEEAAVEKPFRSIKDRHVARLKALYKHFNLDEHRDLEADIELLWKKISTSRIYPEVSEVLPVLAGLGYRLALISNADEDDPVIEALFSADLDVEFETVVTSQSSGAYKPSAQIFQRVLQKLELDPREVVLVGDSPASDIMGAQGVGMNTIWVNRKGIEFPAGYPEPDAEVSDLKGLLELLTGPEGIS